MKKYSFLISFVIFSIITMSGCDVPVPIKEMVSAKKAIDKAHSVKASKYAPKEIEEAEKKLYETHDLVKQDKLEDAKKSADLSNKSAVDAYNKSIPLLALDTIAEAQKSIEEADVAYAEKLAQTEYESAKETLSKAEEKNNNKEYYEAYTLALEADKQAKNARNIAIGKKDVLKDSIDEVKLTIQKTKEYENLSEAQEKLTLAEENLKVAEESYDKLELKKGFSAIEAAKINADEAYVSAAKSTAQEKIANAEMLYNKAGTSAGSKIAVDEMAAAKESLDNAKSMFSESKYSESMEFSKESARLSTIVIATKKPADYDQTMAVKDKGKDMKDMKDVKEDTDVAEMEHTLYTVKRRQPYTDCLWRIAGREYKNPRLWKKIYDANRDRIKDPDLIRPGWILKIPKLDQ